MKDNRFIELVNLYIDRQISAEETAELEAEMQANPRRRALYRQYCQLHTATKQVYQSFRASATEPQAAAPTGRVINAQFTRRPRAHWIHYAGGLTAAACLAVALVRYNATSQPATGALASLEPAPAIRTVTAPPASSEETAVAATPVPSPAGLRNDLAVEPNYHAMLAVLRQDEQRALASGEIQSSRLPSLFDDGVFDARPLPPANSQRTFRGKQAPAQTAEFTAWQFQR